MVTAVAFRGDKLVAKKSMNEMDFEGWALSMMTNLKADECYIM